MKINATFQGKQLAMEEEPCEVCKVISLPDNINFYDYYGIEENVGYQFLSLLG